MNKRKKSPDELFDEWALSRVQAAMISADKHSVAYERWLDRGKDAKIRVGFVAVKQVQSVFREMARLNGAGSLGSAWDAKSVKCEPYHKASVDSKGYGALVAGEVVREFWPSALDARSNKGMPEARLRAAICSVFGQFAENMMASKAMKDLVLAKARHETQKVKDGAGDWPEAVAKYQSLRMQEIGEDVTTGNRRPNRL